MVNDLWLLGSPLSQIHPNLKSTFLHPDAVTEELLKETSRGHLTSFDTGALMAKLDLKYAFCLYPVSSSNWDLLGMHCLFNHIADAYEWVLKHNYAIPALLYSLYDYFIVGPHHHHYHLKLCISN